VRQVVQKAIAISLCCVIEVVL